MALARRAVQIDPTSPYAHRAVGFVYSRMGNRAESIRWMRKAYELNTYDLSMAASYGYALVFSADYREGASILQRAVDASSAHPTWWDYGLFLAEFMLDDMDKASRATDALLMPKKSHYLAARLVVAQSHGDRERVGALAAELVSTYPKFAADPCAVFESGQLPAGPCPQIHRRAEAGRHRQDELIGRAGHIRRHARRSFRRRRESR